MKGGLIKSLVMLVLMLVSCAPKEPVVLRAIENVEWAPRAGDNPLLKADARFYNPNAVRMRLKEIQVEVFIDGKKSASVNQKLKSLIKSKSEFTVPLEVELSMKEIGLADALLSLIGGKKYTLNYKGHLKVSVRGFPVKVPVDYTREVKLGL